MNDYAQWLIDCQQDADTWGDEVPSPCVSVCQMKPSLGRCVGCLRTLDEIAAWGGMDAAAKRATWRAVAERARALLAASAKP